MISPDRFGVGSTGAVIFIAVQERRLWLGREIYKQNGVHAFTSAFT